MTNRNGQTIVWDVENRPVSVSANGTTASFVYDGDGNRVRKTEGGETVLYINRYHEVNLTTGNVTSYYYLGSKLVAMSENTTLRYLHQDHLSGTSLMTDTSGDQIDTTMKYYPFGGTRAGDVPTDKLFTGQRLDSTGLYYYGARYYDPEIGRFISADTIVPNPANPQSFNRYSYCLNNPLKYVDPSGHDAYIEYLNLIKDDKAFDKYAMYFSYDPNGPREKKLLYQMLGNSVTAVIEPTLPGGHYINDTLYEDDLIRIGFGKVTDWDFDSEGHLVGIDRWYYYLEGVTNIVMRAEKYDRLVSYGCTPQDFFAMTLTLYNVNRSTAGFWEIVEIQMAAAKYELCSDGTFIPSSYTYGSSNHVEASYTLFSNTGLKMYILTAADQNIYISEVFPDNINPFPIR